MSAAKDKLTTCKYIFAERNRILKIDIILHLIIDSFFFKDARYTLLMLDPDAPGHSLDSLTFWLHWAVTDIKVGTCICVMCQGQIQRGIQLCCSNPRLCFG